MDREELRDAAAKAFGNDGLMPAREAGWQRIVELGLTMTALPEEAGGLGLGTPAIAALTFELGRVLASAPLLPALPVGRALGAHPAWGERLIEGAFVTTSLMLDRVSGSGGDASDGRLRAVPDADMAGHCLVFGPGLAALVPLDAAGVRLAPFRTWDESRRLYTVELDGPVPADALVLARDAAADALADELERDVMVALAADALGGASAALAMTIGYLQTRRQFDRPLGLFQALKHRCADLRIAIDTATALLWNVADDPAASLASVGAMKAHACETYVTVAEEAIQLHGGIGLTQEYPIHLFMKRATLNAALGRGRDEIMAARGREALAVARGMADPSAPESVLL